MLKQLKKMKKNDGFTIIEVMIVLAIAGLIIMIVLLAVPALQRNGRNTAMKNDASIIAGTISDFASNNDGLAPTSVTAASGTLTVAGAPGSPSTAKIQSGTTVTPLQTATATPNSMTPVVGTVSVWKQAKCPNTQTGATITLIGSSGGASSRQFAIVYSIETSGTAIAKCVDA